ncbi:hypothetical protein CYMTET_39180 [Cymbomonas tetramitiformis]|uniref:Response regulatory domain-containing protein n=1 Tax=Cymbomonas tetramitiformis TaxID=36881 RepID=A0AAE0CAI5_9CHLO|nr:hypothetical protein CYMTET_39180 [Cymbomonas tetramitiformis]
MNDVTNEVQQYQEDRTREHVKAKSISRLLHDLKTPMNVAAAVADDVIDTLQTHDIECKDLSENVQMLRTVARIASDRASAHSLRKESISQYTYTNCVATAIGCTVDLYKPLFSNLHNIQFQKKNYIPLNIAGLIQQEVIRRNLENLISNAIQFTYKGYVIVAYSLLKTTLTFQVIDTGKGVPASKKADIFSGRQLQYTSEGIGIGLQSVMHLSDSVRCLDNPEGHGSVFEFTTEVKTKTSYDADTTFATPREPADTVSDRTPDTNAPETHPLGKDEIRILLVEDDKIQLAIYKNKITRIIPNCKLVTACNGLEGLEMIRQSTFDVIMSDFNMPIDIDSVELATMIMNRYQMMHRVMLELYNIGFLYKPPKWLPGLPDSLEYDHADYFHLHDSDSVTRRPSVYTNLWNRFKQMDESAVVKYLWSDADDVASILRILRRS